jgi:hypothetical protein
MTNLTVWGNAIDFEVVRYLPAELQLVSYPQTAPKHLSTVLACPGGQ